MTRLVMWFRMKKTLVNIADDAHHALRKAHELNRALAVTAVCPGRAEHIRLAHRAERAEALYEQRLAPTEQLTTLRFEHWRNDA